MATQSSYDKTQDEFGVNGQDEDTLNGQNNQTSTHHSLTQAVFARKSEYLRPQKIKIKIASWNVAALPGTEKDIGAWLVDGKGIEESLAGLKFESLAGETPAGNIAQRESVTDQEARVESGHSTIPKNDPGGLIGGSDIGLYVIGLQEIVDVTSASEALRPFNDPGPPSKWRAAISEALPKDYILVAEEQLHGLYLVIYAAPEIAPTISSVCCSNVGTGLMGYMGNKGAVTARLFLGETTRLVFINSHLAAGADKSSLERRNWDAGQIVSRTKFSAVDDGRESLPEQSEMIGDEDFAWWFGDLNYRLNDIPPGDVRRLLLLHTKDQYDGGEDSLQLIDKEIERSNGWRRLSGEESNQETSTEEKLKRSTGPSVDKASEMQGTLQLESTPLDPYDDPTSLQTTISSLLTHDQLRAQQRTSKAFHDGWREGPISFLPTYKYDVGSVGLFDTSEKRRGPSWCDRILFRTRNDKVEFERKRKAADDAKKRDADMAARGVDKAAEAEEVLFDYDPETDGAHAEDDSDYNAINDGMEDCEPVLTKEGSEDRIRLDVYTSHQRILSSDHKPLVAVFTMTYDGVDPVLKSKIHQEVAREFDRAENESRPDVTIAVEKSLDREARDPSKRKDDEVVDFEVMRFDVPKQRAITIANTSRVPTSFAFVHRDEQNKSTTNPGPSWLDVRFENTHDESSLFDGRSSNTNINLNTGDAVNVTLTALISSIDQVQSLNTGTSTLNDTLILRVFNGRDHFIPVHGDWLASSFGRTVEELIRVPEGGVRQLSHPSISTSSSETIKTPNFSISEGDVAKNNQDEVQWSAPRELFRLTGAIEDLVTRAVAEWDMTRDSAGDGYGAGAQSPVPTSTPSSSPWSDNLVWPFIDKMDFKKMAAASDDERPSKHLESLVREALDTDTPFFASPISNTSSKTTSKRPLSSNQPSSSTGAHSTENIIDVSTLDKLSAVASTLQSFLAAMPGGIIDAQNLWPPVDAYILAQEKSKSTKSATSPMTSKQPDDHSKIGAQAQGRSGTQLGGQVAAAAVDEEEEKRMAVLDILSAVPCRSISFVFLTAMLVKILGEISAIDGGGRVSRNESATMNMAARRAALVRLFAPLVIRSTAGEGGAKERDKERRAREERMRTVVDIFVRLE